MSDWKAKAQRYGRLRFTLTVLEKSDEGYKEIEKTVKRLEKELQRGVTKDHFNRVIKPVIDEYFEQERRGRRGQ